MDRVHRRDFLVAAGHFCERRSSPRPSATKVTRMSYLSLWPLPHLRDAFLQGLRELGYVEGRAS